MLLASCSFPTFSNFLAMLNTPYCIIFFPHFWAPCIFVYRYWRVVTSSDVRCIIYISIDICTGTGDLLWRVVSGASFVRLFHPPYDADPNIYYRFKYSTAEPHAACDTIWQDGCQTAIYIRYLP